MSSSRIELTDEAMRGAVREVLAIHAASIDDLFTDSESKASMGCAFIPVTALALVSP